MRVRNGHTAAEQNAGGWTRGADLLDVGGIGFAPGADAGNDDGIRESAIQRVMGGIFEGPIAERDGVFDVDIGEDLRAGTNGLAIAQGVEGVTLDDALVGEHRAAVDIDANKTAIAGSAQGKRGAGVIAQNIETDGQRDGLTDSATNRGHGGDGFGADGRFGERHIAKVFDEHRVRAPLGVSPGIGNGALADAGEVAAPAR